MRILIVGAGALGGYVGARLLGARKDVTFLVRERRAAQLAQRGLQLDSPLGNVALPAIRCVSAHAIDGPYDLVILTCKAYDLNQALSALAPAVGPGTALLPLLNGIAHLDAMAEVYGRERVLGGQCMLAARLSAEGTVRHLNDSHALTLGELDGTLSRRVEALGSLFGDAGFPRAATCEIQLDMWEKWVFLAAAMCLTVLTRIATNPPFEAVGSRLVGVILKECRAVAAAAGFAPRAMAMARARLILEASDSSVADLIVEDLRRQPASEADHLLGDLLQRAQRLSVTVPALTDACSALQQLQQYRAGRPRQTARL